MHPIRFVPVIPFPKKRTGVHMHYGYDLNSELPYVLEISETEWLNGRIETVWGITGMACKNVLILPASLYVDEDSARTAIYDLVKYKRAS